MRAVGLGLAFSLAVVACGGGGSDSARTSDSKVRTGEEEIDRDAVLRVAWNIGPRNMDPHTANSLGDYPFLSLVYDRLVGLSPDEELVPMLATAWEFSDDGTALDMTLREGVTFQDGEPFDAEAVRLNIERAKTLERSTVAGILKPIESVEVVGPQAVRFNLKPGLGANLPSAFTERAGMMISPAAFDDPTLDQYGVGTGPYVVKPGSFLAADRATYVRAPGTYWDAAAHQNFAEIEMIAMPDQGARMNAIQSGQIDVTPLASVSTTKASALGNGPDLDNAVYDARSFFFVGFNLDDPKLQDLKVRQAIAHAIDKEGLVEGVFDGNCLASGQMPLQGDSFFDEALEDPYPYDPAESRRLLEEAGVKNLDLTGTLITTQPMTAHAIAVQAMLADVGITWDLSETLSSQEGLPRWTAGDFQLHAYLQAGRADASGMYQETKDRQAPGGLVAGVDEALAASNDAALSAADREVALGKVNRLMVEEVGQVYICHPQESLLGRSNLIGLDQSPWMRYGTFDVQNIAMVKN